MATFTVTTPDDVVASDGKLSLREAVTQANATTAADTIVFASGLEGKTLTLTGGELVLRQDVTVDGDQNNDRVEVTLSGGNTQRIVRTSGTGTDVVLTDLAVTDGFIDSGAKGGAIFVGGDGLTLSRCTLSDNGSDWYSEECEGGGIFLADGSHATISDSAIVDNNVSYWGRGGGIATGDNVSLVIRRSELSSNGVGYEGSAGAISVGGSLLIEDSRISGNWGGVLGGGIDGSGSDSRMGGCGTRRVAREPLLAGLEELLGPAVIHRRGDPLAAAKLGDALLAAQVLQYDADLLFSRKMPARRAPDVFDDLLCRRFYRLGFLSHLRS